MKAVQVRGDLNNVVRLDEEGEVTGRARGTRTESGRQASSDLPTRLYFSNRQLHALLSLQYMPPGWALQASQFSCHVILHALRRQPSILLVLCTREERHVARMCSRI